MEEQAASVLGRFPFTFSILAEQATVEEASEDRKGMVPQCFSRRLPACAEAVDGGHRSMPVERAVCEDERIAGHRTAMHIAIYPFSRRNVSIRITDKNRIDSTTI
ncbi:MAG: hypothetical protein CPSOU_4516 [uncultured Paraburkholderia sp.]|nr:MAG: hypothetical protein CPSOU_4516 [uncultured Paraburkholderia sp.]